MELFVHGKAVSKNGRPQSAIIPNTPPAGYTGRKFCARFLIAFVPERKFYEDI